MTNVKKPNLKIIFKLKKSLKNIAYHTFRMSHLEKQGSGIIPQLY